MSVTIIFSIECIYFFWFTSLSILVDLGKVIVRLIFNMEYYVNWGYRLLRLQKVTLWQHRMMHQNRWKNIFLIRKPLLITKYWINIPIEILFVVHEHFRVILSLKMSISYHKCHNVTIVIFSNYAIFIDQLWYLIWYAFPKIVACAQKISFSVFYCLF